MPELRPMRRDVVRNRAKRLSAADDYLAEFVLRSRSTTFQICRGRGRVGVGSVHRQFTSPESLLDGLTDGRVDAVVAILELAAEASDRVVGLREAVFGVCELHAADRSTAHALAGHASRPSVLGSCPARDPSSSERRTAAACDRSSPDRLGVLLWLGDAVWCGAVRACWRRRRPVVATLCAGTARWPAVRGGTAAAAGGRRPRLRADGRRRTPRQARTAPPGGADQAQAITAPAPNHLWVGDFTYLRCWEGVVHSSFVIDAFSRMIVGWQLGGHMRTDLVLDALRMALGLREPGADFQLVAHPDAGSQYTSFDDTQVLDDHEVLASIGSVGDALDHALAESFVDSYKTELIADRVWRTRVQLELATVRGCGGDGDQTRGRCFSL